MCLLTSPASSTSSTSSFLFHHSAQFFVIFLLFHSFPRKNVVPAMSRYPAMRGPVEDGQVLQVARWAGFAGRSWSNLNL
jgi:hypothetical protein